MNDNFSKLELWWKDVVFTPDGDLRDINSFFTGYSVVKVFERKWYNPLRYIIARHGVINIKHDKFYI